MVLTLIISDIIMLAVFLLKLSSLPAQIPLFYSRPWGEEQLVDFWMIFLLPLLLHLFFFLNLYFYNKRFLPNPMAKRIIDILNWFLVIFVSIIFVRIILYVS